MRLVTRGFVTGLTVVRHGQDGNLRDGAIAALHTTGTLVDGRQVSVHVTRVTSSAGDFFSGGRDLTEGIAVGGQIGQNDEDVLLELIGVVLGGRQSKAGRDDTFDAAQLGQ